MSTYNILPKEFIHLLNSNSCQWLDLYLFSKVINSHNQKVYLPFCQWECHENIYSPCGKWPGGDYWMNLFWKERAKRVELLVFLTFLNNTQHSKSLLLWPANNTIYYFRQHWNWSQAYKCGLKVEKETLLQIWLMNYYRTFFWVLDV